LSHAATEQRPEQASEQVVVSATSIAASALGLPGLAAALDGDHASAPLPALQHFGELLALIRREILHGGDGRTLQDFRGNLATDALQVRHGFFGAEAFSSIARRVAVHEVMFVGRQFAESLSLSPAGRATCLAVIDLAGIFRLATAEQSLDLV